MWGGWVLGNACRRVRALCGWSLESTVRSMKVQVEQWGPLAGLQKIQAGTRQVEGKQVDGSSGCWAYCRVWDPCPGILYSIVGLLRRKSDRIDLQEQLQPSLLASHWLYGKPAGKVTNGNHVTSAHCNIVIAWSHNCRITVAAATSQTSYPHSVAS